MGPSFTVGGAQATFEGRDAREVASLLDNAFGAEGDWEDGPACHFGEVTGDGWAELRRRAAEELGADALTNLLAPETGGRGVYLPAHVRAVALPLSRGARLWCASLHGLRRELAELAERWELPLDDESLRAILCGAEGGGLAEPPEILGFARLALAANEAVRRDCPLWLVGG